MNNGDNKVTLHQQDSHIYKRKDLSVFKKIIKEHMAKNEDTGREAIAASELYKYTSDSYEMFRKIINTQRITNKRDYIILIGIILKMDSEVIDDLLASYGMPLWNPYQDGRDSKLMEIADDAASSKNPNTRFSEKEINKKLKDEGFPELEVKSNHQRKEKSSYFEILELKSYTIGDYQTMDQYDSIATQYDFDRYSFCAKMYVVEKASKQKYILKAHDSGFYNSKSYFSSDDGEAHFQIYKSLKETYKFEECFREMLMCIHGEKRKIEEVLNDSKNYGERIGAGVKNETFHIFIESYNYDIPERGEYYLLEYINGIYQLFVYNESIFMKMYLPEKEYKMHYKTKAFRAVEKYQTEEDIKMKITDNKNASFEDEMLYRSRLRYYRKLKKRVDDCFEQICAGKVYVRNLSKIFDNEPDNVCWFFDVEKEYDCRENAMGIHFANKENYEFHCPYGSVMITLQDLYNAFEIGYNNIDEICRVKYKTGDVMSILGAGRN